MRAAWHRDAGCSIAADVHIKLTSSDSKAVALLCS